MMKNTSQEIFNRKKRKGHELLPRLKRRTRAHLFRKWEKRYNREIKRIDNARIHKD